MNRIRYAACPLCDGARLALKAEADCRGHALYRAPLPPTIRWRECAECGHVFADGYFDAEAAAMIAAAWPPGTVSAVPSLMMIMSARCPSQPARL